MEILRGWYQKCNKNCFELNLSSKAENKAKSTKGDHVPYLIFYITG